MVLETPQNLVEWWKGSKQGTDLARFRYTAGGQCGGRFEGEGERSVTL